MGDLLFELDSGGVPDISGLKLVQGFVSEEEEQALQDNVDGQPWMHDLKRRVQHYGYRYDYKARIVSREAYLGAIPEWALGVSGRLVEAAVFETPADQLIVNEYLPGQGISAHVDCVPCFGDVIASLSLGSGAVMRLAKGGVRHDVYLPPRSLIVLSGEARYEWTHCIPARKSDVIGGVRLGRDRRISLTFRNVVLR